MLQFAAQMHALSTKVDDTVAAIEQLDADKTQHADFLATYHDQASELPTHTDSALILRNASCNAWHAIRIESWAP